MKIMKAYLYRLVPTTEQCVKLTETAGCCRFVYNHFLRMNMDLYAAERKFIFTEDMINLLPGLKRERTFLKAAFSQSLQSSVRNLSAAFKNFFEGRTEFPTFKKKDKDLSFSCPQKFRVEQEKNRIFIPKIGEVKYRNSRPVEGKIKSITVSKKCGRWYVSVLTEHKVNKKKDPKEKTFDNPTGVDVGLKEFATLSTGEVYHNPKFYRKLEAKLAREQRKLARKKKFSNNWEKQKNKVQDVNRKIADARKDFLHKVSTEIVKNHDLIGVEDLNVSGMMKNRHLSKSIADAGWGTFITFLTYKCTRDSKTLQKVERFYPSSKTCSACGSVKLMPLHLRTYVCGECGSTMDRDYNASINIEKRALELAFSN